MYENRNITTETGVYGYLGIHQNIEAEQTHIDQQLQNKLREVRVLS